MLRLFSSPATARRRRSLSRLRDRDVVERVYGVLDVAGRSIFLLGTIHNSKEQQH